MQPNRSQDPLTHRCLFAKNKFDLDFVKNKLLTDDILIIAGSAISIFEPTRMPNGMRVTEYISELFSCDMTHRDLVRSEIASAAFETVFEACPDRQCVENLFLELYKGKNPNNIHRNITNINRSGQYDIITTNYDECLESSSPGWYVISNEEQYNSRPASGRIFKIHGSINSPDTLVFTISGEKPLDGWKRELFNEMTKGKTVFLIGYSGLDFEICPALMSSQATTIFWNMRVDPHNNNYPSNNAQHMFEIDNRLMAFIGDMRQLFDDNSLIQFGNSDFILAAFFEALDPKILAIWRIRLFDTLGLGYQTNEALNNSINILSAEDHISAEIGINYRYGRYLDSASKCIELSRIKGGRCAEINGLSGAAFRFLNFGRHSKAKILYFNVLENYRKLNMLEKQDTRRGILWLGTLIRLRRPAEHSRAISLARWTAISSLRSGQWIQYYLVKPLLDKHEIDIGEKIGISAPLLPAQQGFLHIGNLSSRIDDYTDIISDGHSNFIRILSNISRGRKSKLNPNLWKCAAGAIKYHPIKSLKALNYMVYIFLTCIMRCQYDFRYKIYIITNVLSRYVYRTTALHVRHFHLKLGEIAHALKYHRR